MALTIDQAINALAEQRGVSPSAVNINDAISYANQSFQQSFFSTPAPTPVEIASRQSNITPTQVADFLQANPGLSDAQIATIANQFNVPASLLSEATNVPVAQIEQRAAAAGVPFTTSGMMSPTPTAATTPTTTAQPATAVASGNAGQYGYQNGAPVLSATVAKQLLGNEFNKAIDIGENNQLGWGTNSRYQGEIVTGAGLYGVRGTKDELNKILSIGEQFKQLQSQGKVSISVDPDSGALSFKYQTGVDPETRTPTYSNARDLFNTAAREDEFNGDANLQKWFDTTLKLQDAATKLNIPTAGKTGAQLLDEVNAKDSDRFAVVGRTQFWDPTQTKGIGGKEGPQHAAVVYQQVGDKLVPASPVQTFDFQDPKTSGSLVNQLVREGLAIPPIIAAVSAFGAPLLAETLTTSYGLPELAAKTISNALIAGTATGVITGDAEKALIASLFAGGATYSVNSGLVGDVLDKVGLSDVRTQFNIPTSAQVSAPTGTFTGIQTGQTPVIGEPSSPINQPSLTGQPITPTPGQGLQLPQVPSLPEMGGAAGVVTAAAGGGMLTQGGVTPTGATPSLGDPNSIINQPGVTGQNVIGQPPITSTTTTTPTVPTTTPTTTPTTPTTTTPTSTVPTTGLLTGAAKVLSDLFGGTTIKDLLNAGIDYATAEKIASDLQKQATGIQEQASAAGRAAQVPFTPYTVTTGMGTTTLGPTGATMAATPAYQQLQQTALQQAQAAAGAINPAQAAQTLFQQAEALAAPTRAREQEALLAGLQRRGLTGFGQNLPTVGGEVRAVNPLFESLLSAQETARANLALQAQQAGTAEALRQQQLSAGLQTQAQNVDIQQLNQLLRAQGLSQDQINLAVKNAEAQRISSLAGLQSSVPLLLDAAGIRSGQTRALGTQARNLAGTIFSAAAPSLFASTAANSGFGTGDLFGNQDYGQYFGS